MAKKGGDPFDADKFAEGVLKADLCAIATTCCFEHGTKVVDAILDRYKITRKSLKEAS